MRYGDVAEMVSFVMGNSRVDIRVWVYQERVMVPILGAHQLRVPTIKIETIELTFHSDPIMAGGQLNRGFPFHTSHDHQIFDEEPITNGLVVSIEQHYGGGTFWA